MLLWVLSVLMEVGLDGQLYVVVLASTLFVWGTYVIIDYHAKRHTNFLHWLVRISIRSHYWRSEWWQNFTSFLDRPEDKLVTKLKEAKAAEPKKPVMEEPIDPDDYKEQDRKKILDYMKGRAEVLVQDIIDNSGANRLRIYSILFEEEQRGRIRVVKTVGMGSPSIVALND